MCNGKEQRAERGCQRPAVGEQQGMERGKVCDVRKRTGCQIAHHDQRHDQLVGGEAQHESQQDDSIQAEQPRKGVEESSQMAENRNAADRDIGEQPDHQPSGRGDRCRPTQDEQGTVEYTAQDDSADLRRTVGGQLEGEGGGHPFQYRRGEQAGGGEREQHAACDDRGQQQGAAGGAAGILLQFPFYAGIMGLMVATNPETGVSLASIIANFFTNISNDVTFPVLTFLSAGIINFFVPSGGGQWAVQAPIVMPAATEMGIEYGRAAMAIAWGDQWTNMIQPFWALPALGIAGLSARNIMGYLVIVLIFTGLVACGGFLLWGAFF